MSREEIPASEGKRAFLGVGQGRLPRGQSVWLTSHSYGRLSLSYITPQGQPREEHRARLAELTSKLVPLEMGLPREFCSADVAFLGLRDGGNVPRMGLPGTAGLLGPWVATDCVFW